MERKVLKRLLASLVIVILLSPVLALPGQCLELVPVGRAVGIEMKSKGMLVAALSKVNTADGQRAPAAEAGIQAGDIIIRLGPNSVESSGDFAAASEKLTGDPVTVTLLRGEKRIQYTVTPALAEDGAWRLGLWLRDGAAGIGTVTFYDPDTGLYGALGHSISDSDTGVTLPVNEGSISDASVTGVLKGQGGSPGELIGSFDESRQRGSILMNTGCGIFGRTAQPFSGDTVESASDKEIVSGPAVILATVDGSEPKEYKVEIARINRGGESRLMVTVTDEKLLSATGGIVQGMSGCPILQKGKLVGAVTHVLLADPSRGYGISIDSMLSAAEKAAA